MNAVAKPMVITAKYVSICKACGRQVEPGDRVEWVRGDKFVSHVQCTDAGRAHVAAVAASRAEAPKADGVEIPCPEGLEYRPFQVAGIQHALSLPEGVLIADEMGLGKQQPVDSWVATPTGWRRIGDLLVGDFVIGSDGKRTKVTGVFPQGVKPSYRVHASDGSSVEAGPEHLWTVSYWRGGKY